MRGHILLLGPSNCHEHIFYYKEKTIIVVSQSSMINIHNSFHFENENIYDMEQNKIKLVEKSWLRCINEY